MTVDDIGLRPSFGAVELCSGLAGVANRGQVHMASDDEVRIGIGIFVDADGEDDQIGLIVVQIKQRWQFHKAGLAPSGPEVEQHNFAPVVG